MSFRPDSDRKKIDDLESQIDLFRDSQINAEGGNEENSIFGTKGGRNSAHGDEGGVRSSIPIPHDIVDIDLAGTATAVFDKLIPVAKSVIVDAVGSAIDLRWIHKLIDGHILNITPKATKTVTLKSGGNIAVSGDVVITDSETCQLQYFADTDKWKCVTTGSGSGGGSLSEPLRQKLYDLGNVGLSTVNIDLDVANYFKMTLTGDISIAFNETIPSLTPVQIFHIFIDQDGTGGHNVTSWPVNLIGTPSIDLGANQRTHVTIITHDQGSTYEFVLSSGPITVGGSGITKLSELEIDVTKDWNSKSISNLDGIGFNETNQSINPDPVGIVHAVDDNQRHQFFSDINKLAEFRKNGTEMFLDLVDNELRNASRIRFPENAVSTVVNIPEIHFDDIVDAAMVFNVPNLRGYNWKENGNSIMKLTETGVGGFISNLGLIELSDQLKFLDSLVAPSSNGEMRRQGNTIKAFVNGAVVDLADIGSGGGSSLLHELIADEPIDVNRLTIFDELSDMIVNLPTSSDVFRIRQANTTPSIASFSSNEISFEENLDMNNNFIDNVLKVLFDANAIPTSTRQVAGTADGLFIGVPSTEKIIFGEGAVNFLEMENDKIFPSVDNAVDLGINTVNRFKNMYLAGDGNILGGLIVGGATTLQGNTQIGNSNSDTVVFDAEIDSDVRLRTGYVIAPDQSNAEIGIFTNGNPVTIGANGSLGLPFSNNAVSTKVQADIDFGAKDGCVGVYGGFGGTPSLVVKSFGNWYVNLFSATPLP